ncbi:MAG TPA: hypothetical protein VFX98_10560, partial [Longimicrobiaceae bacterium]|nr:hypothetical protein [Longimicrobiaceae bacterium]
MKLSPRAPAYAGLLGLATGLAIGTAWSSPGARLGLPTVEELRPSLAVDPLERLGRAEMALAAERARASLEAGRPWAAWGLLRGFVDEADEAPAAVALLAARAAAGWGGWSQVDRLLAGRP